MPRYTFGSFSLDSETRLLLRDGEPVLMAGKTLDTLLVLVQNRGRLVDKDELLARIWPGTVVEEANLSQNIFTVRKILGDSPKDHRYIATIAGRGYQFVAPVAEVTAATLPEPHRFWARNRTIPLTAIAVAVVLAAWFVLRFPSKTPAELTQLRLTFNPSENPVGSAAISPDGRYLAYSDTAGIRLKLLSTGEERLIPTPGGVPLSVASHVDSWFPDGTQLLVHSKDADGHGSMWTTSVMGQSTSELRRDASGWAVSPDGRHIAFSPSVPLYSGREIWMMDSQGDNAQKILGLEADEWLWSVHWSPDGQRLAYIRAKRVSNKLLQFTETCDLKGANRVEVLAIRDQDPWVQDIVWLPEGRIVYSQLESPTSNNANLWQIDVDTQRGTPTSRPRRLTQRGGPRLWGLSASADGKRLALQKATFQGQAYLGQLEAGGTRMPPPRRLTKDEANDSPMAWTTDSKAVLSVSDRDGIPVIFKQAIARDEPEVLTAGQKSAYLPRLSPDGASVLYLEPSATPAVRMMRIPVNGGLPQFVLELRNWIDFQCTGAPANLCAILEESEDQKQLILTAFDPIKGRGKLLRAVEKDPNAGDFAAGLSPDGAAFAIARRGEAEIHIRLLSLSGGADREIIVRNWPNISGLYWSADGKGFYCGSTSPQGSSLLHADLTGTAQVLWRNTGATGIGGVPSPDGRYLALWAESSNSNVWVLEGF